MRSMMSNPGARTKNSRSCWLIIDRGNILQVGVSVGKGEEIIAAIYFFAISGRACNSQHAVPDGTGA